MQNRHWHANANAVDPRSARGWRLRAARAWRTTGTGLCFVGYASLGWLAGITILPLLMLWPGSAADRQRRIRAFVAGSFRALLGAIALLRLGRVEVEGTHWLREAGGKLLVANHPMYLDVVALVGQLPQADCVVKQAMWRNRFYRRFVRAIGYIGNADSVSLMHACVERLRDGHSLILFPEGTRSTPGETLRFHRSAAQIAVRGDCRILPVVIHCEPLALGKHQAWHEVGDRPWRLRLQIGPPRSLAQLGHRPDMPPAVAARHVNRALETLFRERLAAAADEAADDGSLSVAGEAA